MGSRSFYLMRHLLTSHNVNDVIIGQVDIPLNALQIQNHKFDAIPKTLKEIWCSPLKRCASTAALLVDEHRLVTGKSLPVVYMPELKERHMGDWEGASKAEIWSKNPGLFANGFMNPQVTPPNGESLPDFLTRVREVLRRAMMKRVDDGLVVCSHNQLLKLLIHLYYHDECLNQWTNIMLPYGRLVRINAFEELVSPRLPR